MSTLNEEERALREWDREHGMEDQESPSEQESISDFVGSNIQARIIESEESEFGIEVGLPESKNASFLLAASIIRTMAKVFGSSTDEILYRIHRIIKEEGLVEAHKKDFF